MDNNEANLIKQACQNTEAFRELYRHYSPRVYSYIAARINNRQDAEDLTSETFVRVLEGLPTFEYRGNGSFAAWVFRIAYTTVQQRYRQTTRRRWVSLDFLPLQDKSVSPVEHVFQQETSQELQQLIETLSLRRREIIYLRFYAELSNQEISKVLKLDERTVASHLSRGIRDLQEKFHELLAKETYDHE
ncbi:sigma-70 family RNA polymerase sigma factor [bacterium]|nr:sigma-70 family RNA polymerase sigma factor [bacterium]